MSIILSVVKDPYICIFRGNRWVGIRFFWMDVIILFEGFYPFIKGTCNYIDHLKEKVDFGTGLLKQPGIAGEGGDEDDKN